MKTKQQTLTLNSSPSPALVEKISKKPFSEKKVRSSEKRPTKGERVGRPFSAIRNPLPRRACLDLTPRQCIIRRRQSVQSGRSRDAARLINQKSPCHRAFFSSRTSRSVSFVFFCSGSGNFFNSRFFFHPLLFRGFFLSG